MNRRRLTIGLLWHSVNAPNLGLGALTLGHLALLDELAEGLGIVPDYVVAGAAGTEPAYVARPDLRALRLRTRDFLTPAGELMRALRASDVVLDIGGGDSFTDIYGAGRCRRLLATKAAALALGRPLVLAPQTIGPFERGWARCAARGVMNRAALVATRDPLSTGFAREIGVSAPLVEVSDVALRLPFEAQAPRAAGAPLRVGLNPSGLLFNGGYTGANQFGLAADHPALLRAICARLTGTPGVELHLVGHVLAAPGSLEDDQTVAGTVAAEIPGAVVAPRFAGPSEAKSYIAGLDAFIGARMHACIAAFSAGVPVLPLAYSRKFAGLFGSLGQDLVADLRSEGETEVLERLDAQIGRAHV